MTEHSEKTIVNIVSNLQKEIYNHKLLRNKPHKEFRKSTEQLMYYRNQIMHSNVIGATIPLADICETISTICEMLRTFNEDISIERLNRISTVPQQNIKQIINSIDNFARDAKKTFKSISVSN